MTGGTDSTERDGTPVIAVKFSTYYSPFKSKKCCDDIVNHISFYIHVHVVALLIQYIDLGSTFMMKKKKKNTTKICYFNIHK